MKITRLLSTIAIFVLAGVAVYAQTPRAYRGTFRSVRQLILRIENHTDLFRDSLDAELNRNPVDTTAADDDINLFVGDFDDAVGRLLERFDRRQSTAADAQEVLDRAARIDSFMGRHPLDAETKAHWSNLQVDLDQLARAYRISRMPPAGRHPVGLGAHRLTGTYRLDVSRSDAPRDMADRATRDLPGADRQRVLDDLAARLEPPEQIAIDVRGPTVTMASTRAPQITFEADGHERIETAQNGRTVRVRAMLNGEQLIVSRTGDTANDFSVTFESINSGQMNVTRRVYSERLTRPVVVQSTYNKTADVAQFDIFRGTPNYPASRSDFIVPDGTAVMAVLNDSLSTKATAVGDRFTMTVRQPSEFEGATIEGHVTQVRRSGRLTGRSEMTLNFDNIRLRDGRSFRFAGLVQEVRAANGERVRVDTEGAARESSQTRKTEERAAIGAGIGAVIGAIAGGGKGAAIGAILGAGGGAGSVYVQGREDLELGSGSEVTIRASAPSGSVPR